MSSNVVPIVFESALTPPPDRVLPDAALVSGANLELRAAMQAATLIVHGEVITRAPHFMGTLRSSILPETFGNYPDLYGRVATASPYAQPVETGSKPHWPPRGPLELWVRRKLAGKGSLMQATAKDRARIQRRDFSNALSRGYIRGRRASTANEIQEQMIRSTAFLVARKISRFGTPGFHMFKYGFAAAHDDAMDVFVKARDRIIERWSKI